MFVFGKTIHFSYTEKTFLDLVTIKSNLDCNYTFQIDLTPNGNPFGDGSIGKL